MNTSTLLALVCCTYVALASPTCYNSDGTEIMDVAFQPCSNDTAHNSVCCGLNHSGVGHADIADDICETNGLCQNWAAASSQDPGPGAIWWRSSCTDPTWESPYCLKDIYNSGPLDDNAPVIKCNAQQWCCGGDCCHISASLFTLSVTVGPTSTPSSHSSTTSQIATKAPTTIPAAPTVTISSIPCKPDTLNGASKAGIGIGAAGGAALLAVIGFFSVEVEKKEGKQR